MRLSLFSCESKGAVWMNESLFCLCILFYCRSFDLTLYNEGAKLMFSRKSVGADLGAGRWGKGGAGWVVCPVCVHEKGRQHAARSKPPEMWNVNFSMKKATKLSADTNMTATYVANGSKIPDWSLRPLLAGNEEWGVSGRDIFSIIDVYLLWYSRRWKWNENCEGQWS